MLLLFHAYIMKRDSINVSVFENNALFLKPSKFNKYI